METVGDESPQFVNVEPCGVNYDVRHLANWIHENALAPQAFADRPVVTERMRAAGFAVSPQKRFFGCLNENKFRGQAFAMKLANRFG